METHLRMTTEGSSKDNDNQHAARILFLPPTRIADKTASGNAGSSQSVALEFWRDRSSHRAPQFTFHSSSWAQRDLSTRIRWPLPVFLLATASSPQEVFHSVGSLITPMSASGLYKAHGTIE